MFSDGALAARPGWLDGQGPSADIVVSTAFKPTSSLRLPCRGLDIDGNEVEVVTKGRHDPCVGIRAVPVAEAMAAAVVLDHLLLDRGVEGFQHQRRLFRRQACLDHQHAVPHAQHGRDGTRCPKGG